VPGWHQWINHMNPLYSLKRYCQEAMLYDILRGSNDPLFLWR
jgi:hypothetical protein